MTNYAKHETDEVAAIVRECFSYDAESGVITRIKSNYMAYVGKLAHVATSNSKYFIVKVHKRYYLAHRVAWLLHYGVWPEMMIDHKDGNGQNNKATNLRKASSSVNARNRRRQMSASGHTGIDWFPKIKKWHARIKFDGKVLSLGFYVDLDDAIKARKSAQRKFGFHPNHGIER